MCIYKEESGMIIESISQEQWNNSGGRGERERERDGVKSHKFRASKLALWVKNYQTIRDK